MRLRLFTRLTAILLLAAACTTSKPSPRDPVNAHGKSTAPFATKPVLTTDVQFDVLAKAPKPLGPCKLRATLTRPKDIKASTLVVIAQGTGLMTYDGTAGATAIDRDVGTGLAARGHATLRFEPRTAVKACAAKLQQTVTTAVFLADIVQVTTAAMARPEAAALKLVLFGHGEGVTLVAELGASQSLSPAAYVLAAGLGRFPIDATVLRQLHLARDQPGLTPAGKAKIDKRLADGERLFLAIREGRTKPRDVYLGASPAYWRDMIALTDRAYQTVGELRAPTLAIQGELDDSVTRDDHLALAEATSKIKGSTARLMPGIGHLMMVPGKMHVADLWLDTVAAWLDAVTGTGVI